MLTDAFDRSSRYRAVARTTEGERHHAVQPCGYQLHDESDSNVTILSPVHTVSRPTDLKRLEYPLDQKYRQWCLVTSTVDRFTPLLPFDSGRSVSVRPLGQSPPGDICCSKIGSIGLKDYRVHNFVNGQTTNKKERTRLILVM